MAAKKGKSHITHVSDLWTAMNKSLPLACDYGVHRPLNPRVIQRVLPQPWNIYDGIQHPHHKSNTQCTQVKVYKNSHTDRSESRSTKTVGVSQ